MCAVPLCRSPRVRSTGAGGCPPSTGPRSTCPTRRQTWRRSAVHRSQGGANRTSATGRFAWSAGLVVADTVSLAGRVALHRGRASCACRVAASGGVPFPAAAWGHREVRSGVLGERVCLRQPVPGVGQVDVVARRGRGAPGGRRRSPCRSTAHPPHSGRTIRRRCRPGRPAHALSASDGVVGSDRRVLTGRSGPDVAAPRMVTYTWVGEHSGERLDAGAVPRRLRRSKRLRQPRPTLPARSGRVGLRSRIGRGRRVLGWIRGPDLGGPLAESTSSC